MKNKFRLVNSTPLILICESENAEGKTRFVTHEQDSATVVVVVVVVVVMHGGGSSGSRLAN